MNAGHSAISGSLGRCVNPTTPPLCPEVSLSDAPRAWRYEHPSGRSERFSLLHPLCGVGSAKVDLGIQLRLLGRP